MLAELAALYLTEAGPTHTASPVQRAFSRLLTLLDAQAGALAEIDRIEADLISRFGYPRMSLPVRPGSPPTYAADPSTIRRLLGTGPEARRPTAGLRRRQSRFMRAAEAAGLPGAHTRERALAVEIADLTATLLLAPVVEPADLARKLITLIAMAEPGPADAAAFPGRYLRTLLADFIQLHGLASANSRSGANAKNVRSRIVR
ncbi:hypothetical protein MKK75_32115 [Methylobacterium sp. J-030]|nr:hypothetical protein [Methylobacterium sp. J-030]